MSFGVRVRAGPNELPIRETEEYDKYSKPFELKSQIWTLCSKISKVKRPPKRYCCLVFLILLFLLIYTANYSFCDTTNHLQFIHIPKTGGTTVTRVGAKHGYLWGVVHWNACSLLPFQFQRATACVDPSVITNSVPHHLPPRYHKCSYEKDNVRSTYYMNSFCVVRNPYTKLLSEYQYRAKRGDKSFCKPRKMNKILHSW